MQKKVRNRQYPTETITDTEYADDTALLANIPAKAESILHSLEQTVRGIGLEVNANKTECMGFKREGAISTLSGRPLKFVGKLTDLGSNISS